MDDWIQDVGGWMGLSPEATAAIAALLGVAMATVSVGWLLSVWLEGRGGAGAARLVPTLAEDVLDADLAQIYRRSWWLDARLFEGYALGGDTGSRLGRTIRRDAVRMQAERVAPQWREALRAKAPALKTPEQRAAAAARVARLNAVLDEALGYLARLDELPRARARAHSADISSKLQQWVRRVDPDGGDESPAE